MPFTKGHTHWKHPNSRKTQFTKGQQGHKGFHHTELSNEKNRLAHLGKLTGAQNPSWKGGITPLLIKIKRLSIYKAWQAAVLKRDNFTCRQCHKRGGDLTPHHLTAFSFLIQHFKIGNVKDAAESTWLWNVRNGVTLCPACHAETSNYGWRASKHPKDWALYPKIVGVLLLVLFTFPNQTNAATFGYTTAGATTASVADNQMQGQEGTPITGGIVDEVWVYYSDTGSGGVKALVTDSSSDNIIDSRIGNPGTPGTPARWVASGFSSPPQVVANTLYVVWTIFDEGGTALRHYDAAVSDGWTASLNSYATPTAPAGEAEEARNYSIYAVYHQNVTSLADFSYCREMTMTAGGGSGGVATTSTLGLPLFASTTLSTLAGTTSGGRIQSVSLASTNAPERPRDLIVTSDGNCDFSTGTVLDFYTEKYASTTGAIAFWLEGTDVSSTTPKDVNIYYGYATSSEFQYHAGVWDGVTDWLGSWNLADTPRSNNPPDILDATANALHGSSTGAMNSADAVTGQVGGAVDFDNSNDWISLGDVNAIDSATQLTNCMWLQSTTLTDDDVLVSKRVSGGFQMFRDDVGVGGNDLFSWFMQEDAGAGGTATRIETAPGTSVSGRPQHVCGTLVVNTAAGMKIYLDGASAATPVSTVGIGNISAGTDALFFGVNSGLAGPHSGFLDDVRIATVAIDPMDILTYYNNTKSSSVFWTIGAEQSQGGGTPTFQGVIRAFINGIVNISGLVNIGN